MRLKCESSQVLNNYFHINKTHIDCQVTMSFSTKLALTVIQINKCKEDNYRNTCCHQFLNEQLLITSTGRAENTFLTRNTLWLIVKK